MNPLNSNRLSLLFLLLLSLLSSSTIKKIPSFPSCPLLCPLKNTPINKKSIHNILNYFKNKLRLYLKIP
jgi:hypothetical protein